MNKEIREFLHQLNYDFAHRKGMEALNTCTPIPMEVAQRANPLDDTSEIVKSWHVAEGVCGFAWVNIKPANSSFARWLKKQGIGRKAYYGGLDIPVYEGGQSYEKKMAYAEAFAQALKQIGITAYAEGRLD